MEQQVLSKFQDNHAEMLAKVGGFWKGPIITQSLVQRVLSHITSDTFLWTRAVGYIGAYPTVLYFLSYI
jgi:hypothetical protein